MKKICIIYNSKISLFNKFLLNRIIKILRKENHVETFGTEKFDVLKISQAVNEVFDLRPAAVIRDLNLLRPIYAKTAAYGHFGRELPDFTWEKTDRAAALKALVK